MPFSVGWYLVHQVSEARLWGHVTLDEMEAYTDRCVDVLTEAQINAPDTRIHMLVDALDAESLPPIYRMFNQGMRTLRFKNRDTMFLVTRNGGQVRSVIELASRLAGEHFALKVFSDREQAIAALTAAMAKKDRPL